MTWIPWRKSQLLSISKISRISTLVRCFSDVLKQMIPSPLKLLCQELQEAFSVFDRDKSLDLTDLGWSDVAREQHIKSI